MDEEVTKLVDIGFPALKVSRSETTKLKTEHFKQIRSDPNYERLARTEKCK